jgi:alpha-galactosidase
MDQHSQGGRQLSNSDGKIVWAAKDGTGTAGYVALFNMSDMNQTVEYPLQSLGGNKTAFTVRDVWAKRDLTKTDLLKVELAPHASILYRVK